jgi:hypothetical protein
MEVVPTIQDVACIDRSGGEANRANGGFVAVGVHDLNHGDLNVVKGNLDIKLECRPAQMRRN